MLNFLGLRRILPSSHIGFRIARVAELADAADSKSADESLVGSTPTPGTSALWNDASDDVWIATLVMLRRGRRRARSPTSHGRHGGPCRRHAAEFFLRKLLASV